MKAIKQKWLVIPTESFSPRGLKGNDVTFDDLPWIVRTFLSAYPKVFIALDESSRIKTNTPMKESAKSSRTRLIKLLNKTNSDRCIMTGTPESKSPYNLVDQYKFLSDEFFPESAWEFFERYAICETIRIGRGRRVLVSQKDWKEIRRRLARAHKQGGEGQLIAAKEVIYKQYGIDYHKQEWIIQHRRYEPFINHGELMRRIEHCTMFVKRKDVFDIKHDKFVEEPIKISVELGDEAKRIAKELIDLGFTDNFTLGKAPALELMMRLQDVCNGFEPTEAVPSAAFNLDLFDKDSKPERKIVYRPLKENPKIDALMELLEEIDTEANQVVVWSSRTALLRAAKNALDEGGIASVVYDGSASDEMKAEAEGSFASGSARVFIANQASGAYGLNCLARASYAIYLCIDGSVEKYVQSQHRILRGELAEPRFAYSVYVAGSIEERLWEAVRVGKELIDGPVDRGVFDFT
jgi:hypothetical protein